MFMKTDYLEEKGGEEKNIPPSTRVLQVPGENLFKDSITRGVQNSSDAANPR